VRWEDRIEQGASHGGRDSRKVHNLRVSILRSIQKNVYKDCREDWDSHPEEETKTTGISGSGNEVGKVRL